MLFVTVFDTKTPAKKGFSLIYYSHGLKPVAIIETIPTGFFSLKLNAFALGYFFTIN